MTGQNKTSGPIKYALARRLLAGRVLADFSHAESVHGSKTLVNYAKCIQAVTLWVFLQKSLQDQKRWMRRFLKKPWDMPVREYIARVIEIYKKVNEELKKFKNMSVSGNKDGEWKHAQVWISGVNVICH